MDVVPERGEASGGDVLAEEVELSEGEHALFQFESQPVGGEDGEECSEVFPVLLLGFAVHTIII
jgi:hypothetical protein